MSNVRNKQVGLLLILVAVTLFLVLVSGSAAAGPQPAQGGEVQLDDYDGSIYVIPPTWRWTSRLYQWLSVKWWKSMFALPADEDHPILAEGDVDCSYGQNGKVWFLAGSNFEFTVGEKNVERTCKKPIPLGKTLFFPVMNVVCNTYDDDDVNFGSLTDCAKIVTDNFVIPLSATVDGVEIENLEAYRTISKEFTIKTSDPPLYGYTPPGGKGVTGGYYLLLPPLSRGKHQITFSGKILIPDEVDPVNNPPPVDYTVNVSYDFTVGWSRWKWGD